MTDFKFGDVLREPTLPGLLVMFLGIATESFVAGDGYIVDKGEYFGYTLASKMISSTAFPIDATCWIGPFKFEKVP